MWRWLAAAGGLLFGWVPPEAAAMFGSWPTVPEEPTTAGFRRAVPGSRRMRRKRRASRPRRHAGRHH